LYTFDTEDSAFSAGRDTGELLYLQSTGNGARVTLIERYPDEKTAHRIRFFTKGRFFITTTGPATSHCQPTVPLRLS
jgi:hypothetical protein